MTDSRHAPDIFAAAEPARDRALGALLGEVAAVPQLDDADWVALAARIAVARAAQRTAWWSYAARWERRAIPVAIAAGLAGVLALWGLGMPGLPRGGSAVALADPVAEVVQGTPAADAARTFARSVASADDLTNPEVY